MIDEGGFFIRMREETKPNGVWIRIRAYIGLGYGYSQLMDVAERFATREAAQKFIETYKLGGSVRIAHVTMEDA